MNLKPLVTGLALAKTLVVAYILCAIAQIILPGVQFSHMWLALFSAAPMGSLQMWLEGIVVSIVLGFVLGYVFAWSYNWVSSKTA
mgnify:CR=1 FL=1